MFDFSLNMGRINLFIEDPLDAKDEGVKVVDCVLSSFISVDVAEAVCTPKAEI